MQQMSPSPNPLAQLAASTPARLLVGVSIAARVGGIALALFYAYDQSYDGTQVYTVAVAALLAMSLAPLRAPVGEWLAAAGTALLLFACANLATQPAGVAMIVTGAGGWLAVAALSERRHTTWVALAGLLVGAVVAFAAAVATIGLVEG